MAAPVNTHMTVYIQDEYWEGPIQIGYTTDTSATPVGVAAFYGAFDLQPAGTHLQLLHQGRPLLADVYHACVRNIAAEEISKSENMIAQESAYQTGALCNGTVLRLFRALDGNRVATAARTVAAAATQTPSDLDALVASFGALVAKVNAATAAPAANEKKCWMHGVCSYPHLELEPLPMEAAQFIIGELFAFNHLSKARRGP